MTFVCAHCGIGCSAEVLSAWSLALLEYAISQGEEEGLCLSIWEGRRRLSRAGHMVVELGEP